MDTRCGVGSDDALIVELMDLATETCGAVPADAGEPLRDAIPNSLALLQLLMAVEERYGCRLDHAGLAHAASLRDLAGAVRAAGARGRGAEGAAEPGAIPLNPIQIAYLLGDDPDLELGGQATFIYLETVHDGTAGPVAERIRGLLARHDVFTHRPDVMTGALLPGEGAGAPVTTEDDAPGTGREEMLAAARQSNRTGPMCRAHVLDRDPGRPGSGPGVRVLWYFNMVLMDAGSVYLLLDELRRVLAGGEPAPAPALGAAVRRIAARRDPAARAAARDYWRTRAAQLPARPTPATIIRGDRTWSTTRRSEILDPGLVADLEAAAAAEHVTVSALLLAMHAAVVCRWTGAAGVTVNLTVSDRALAGPAAGALGDFTSSVLVGAEPAAAAGLGELAREVDRGIADGLAHRALGGVEVMQEFLRGGADQTIATAPIVFTSYVGGATGPVGAGAAGTEVDFIYTQTAQVCLDIQVMPRGDGLVLSWDSVDDYFPGADAMFARTIDVIREVAAGARPWPIVDPATTRELAAYNDTGATPGAGETLLTLLDRTRRATPDAIAVTGGDGATLTYRELWESAGRVARHLLDEGCRPGDAVIVEFTRHPDDLVNMVAVLRAGAAWVPLDAGAPAQRGESVRRQSGAALTLRTGDPGRCAHLDPGVPEVAPDPAATAYVIFTSGTTGEPKGVVIPHSGCVGTILDVNEDHAVGPGDHFIALSSYGFDLSIYDVFGAFAAGASVGVVADERDADEILGVIDRDGVTLWNSAPALLELALLRRPPDRVYPTVRTVMLSGDRIPPALVAEAERAFPNATVQSLGGATEASIWSIRMPVRPDSFAEGVPYGRPMRGQGFHVLGPDQAPCPIGVPGELWISGGGLASGYAGDPERTAAAFREVPGIGRAYRTGDLGVFGGHGYIEFLGRVDRQVKIAGHRIELAEIESVLARSGLCAAVVAGTFDRGGRPALYCAYLPGGGDPGPAEIRGELRGHLPEYMIPAVLLPLTELPVTGNGKIDYRALADRAAAAGGDGGPAAGAAPGATAAAPVPEEVRAAWAAALGREPTSDTASFFAEGGDSLGFQRMLRLVEEATGVRPRFREVIADPSLRTLAGVVAAGSRPPAQEALAGEPAADAGGPHDPFPLTDMQMAYYIGRGPGFALGGVTEHYYLETLADIDPVRLEDALNRLIRRHPMLRAVFGEDATQRILPEVPRYRIEVADYADATAAEIERAILDRRDRLSHETFTLSRWPLFSLEAMRLPDGRHRLFFSIDMIIGDGASQRIFLEDLSRLYRGAEPLPLAGTFRDYVLELDRRRAAADPFAALGPDRQHALVTGFPPGCTLPVPRTTLDGPPRMSRLSHSFDREQTTALKEAARAMGCSLSALLLAAYAASLAAFATGDRVGVNVTTYNRDDEIGEHRNIIGDFTGVVLLPFESADVADLAELAADTQRELLRHLGARYPGVRLIADIARHHGVVGEAVAPFVFTSLLFDDDPAGAGGATGGAAAAGVLGEVDWAVSQTPQVILDNQVLEVDGGLNISWDHVADVLPEELAGDIFAHHLRTLSSCIAGDPGIATLTRAESRRLRLALAARGGSPVARGAASGATAPDAAAASAETLDRVLALVRERPGAGAAAAGDNLFDHGYDSIGFVSLVQRIQVESGRAIPLADALASPTPATLARLAEAAAHGAADLADSPLILLRDGDPDRPVVFIHGGFGTVDVYRDLAAALPGGRRCWGIGFDRLARPWPRRLSVEEIAAGYAADIRATVPAEVPVSLVGWSVGGTLAAAVAAELGADCAALALLDSIAPGTHVDVGEFALDADLDLLRAAGADGPPLPGLDPDAADHHALWRALCEAPDQAAGVRAFAAAVSPHLLEDLGMAGAAVTYRDLSTLRTLIDARNRYRPTGPLPAALFIAPDDGEAGNRGDWLRYGIPSLHVAPVRGNHYSFILGDDAAATARLIGDHLTGKGA